MSDLETPFLASPAPTLGENHFERIRSVLIEAGVTSNMLDLPEEHAKDEDTDTPHASYDAPTRSTNDTDVEQDKSRRSYLQRTLSAMSFRAKHNIGEKNMVDEYPLHEGVYNMFFLSKNWSAPFFYSVLTFCNKLALYCIVVHYIYKEGGFRDTQRAEIALIKEDGGSLLTVQFTQLMLIPAAIGISEELLISMTVLGTVGWTKLPNHPQATQIKFWITNVLRGFDGLAWLFIITSLMIYAHDILNMFLNFAALQFLQSIDNAAYEMAKQGFLSSSFEKVTMDVANAKMKTLRNTWRDYTDSIILAFLFVLIIIAWAVVNFYDNA